MTVINQTNHSPRFWVGVVSESHVVRGVEGGFCQVCHGKSAPPKTHEKRRLFVVLQSKNRFIRW